MAIIGEFEVQVIVNHKVAKEYDDDEEDDEPGIVTRYIEAVSGAPFKFHIKISPTYRFDEEDGISTHNYFDGVRYPGIIHRREKHSPQTGLFSEIKDHFAGCGRDQKCLEFSFADLETRDVTEQDDITDMKRKYDKLGTLRLELWRVRVLGVIDSNNQTPKTLGTVPEKALKGRPLDVSTCFKPVEFTRAPETMDVKRLDSEPLAKFIFKYRTKKGLQSLLLIPRSESPVPIDDRPVEELSPEEMRQLLRRKRDQAQTEIKEEGERRKLKLKRAATPSKPVRPLKTSRTSEGKTVYHLESDDEEGSEEKPGDSSRVDEEIEIIILS